MGDEHYFASAVRHAVDARHLLDGNRTDNAAYLAGYTIECALKLLIKSSAHYTGGMPWLHDLLSLETLALAATIAAVDADDAFPHEAVAVARDVGWTIHWRYVPDSTVSHADATRLVDAAHSVVSDTLCMAALDGRIGR